MILAAFLAVVTWTGLSLGSPAQAAGDPKRGEYIAQLGGCLGCHTEKRKGAASYAGGRALVTPFGTFYGPNITPHPEAGIGRWTEADFARAMRHGVRPDGANYFPAFPYASFNRITEADLADLWAYLRSLPQNDRANQKHDLRFPFGWRFLVSFWKWLYFSPSQYADTPGATQSVNRGAYIIEVLGHCGECHTPRNFLGGPIVNRRLGGGDGADGKGVPNLTPTRLERWGDEDLKKLFLTGVTPDDETVSESMYEVVSNTTSKMNAADIAAMIAYLRSLKPIPNPER